MRARDILPAAALLAGFMAMAGLARAQSDSGAPPLELADAYQLTNADGDRVCPIRLLPAQTRTDAKDAGKPAAKDGANAAAAHSPHFAVELDRGACAGAILFSADIAAWAPGPGNAIRLFSGEGRLIAEFTEGVGGTWEALREEDGVYFLVNTRLAEPAAALQPQDMAGAWQVADGAGAPLCRMTLTDRRAGEAFQLTLEPACAGKLPRPLPDRWRLDGADLLLLGAGGARLRFAASEDAVWSKVPAEGQPLQLSRLP